jgi:O-antigen/teichoic acid export membrane protein
MIRGRGTFASRIAGLFVGRVAQFVIGFTTSFLLARLLGPAGRGAYQLVILTPTTLFAVGQLGLPAAFSFFSGRGRSMQSLQRASLLLAAGLSAVLLLLIFAALPGLERTVLRAAPAELLPLALISLPFQFVASFSGSILIGRQRLRSYVLILVAQSLAVLALVVILVGVAGLGVAGAVIANVAVAAAGAIAMGMTLRRTVTDVPDEGPQIRLGELTFYGVRLYPASAATYLSYRADIFMIAWLLGDPRAVGIYTLAVSLAELTFFIPDSVSTVFFARVAGSERQTADQLAPMVSRMTVLVTALGALALIPLAFAAVHVVLPAFVGSLPAFLVILPGVMALAVSKVLASYVSGLGMPLPVAAAAVASLIVNLVANLLFIPLYGIIGASISSVVSYGLHTTILVAIACRLSRLGPGAYLVPTRAEVARLVTGVGQLGSLFGAQDPRPSDER